MNYFFTNVMNVQLIVFVGWSLVLDPAYNLQVFFFSVFVTQTISVRGH